MSNSWDLRWGSMFYGASSRSKLFVFKGPQWSSKVSASKNELIQLILHLAAIYLVSCRIFLQFYHVTWRSNQLFPIGAFCNAIILHNALNFLYIPVIIYIYQVPGFRRFYCNFWLKLMQINAFYVKKIWLKILIKNCSYAHVSEMI